VRQDGLRHCAGKVESWLFRTPVAFYEKNLCIILSGADLGCFIPDPDFFHPGFRISDPGFWIQQQRGEEKISCLNVFYRHECHKLKIVLFFEKA
jgi:hypothetical protein